MSVMVGVEGRPETAGEAHVVGAQRDPTSAAGAEFGLAVGAEVTTAVGEFGLVADATGGRVVLLLGLLLAPRLRSDATHFLFVALELLVQRSGGWRGEVKLDPFFHVKSWLLTGRNLKQDQAHIGEMGR